MIASTLQVETYQMSGRGGRAPSGPWSRLKPVNLDPLESYGLPSKGDNRLLSFKIQEQYYTKIVDRYMSFCSRAGRGDELLRRFSALQLQDPSSNTEQSTTPALAPEPTTTTAAATLTSSSTTPPLPSPNTNPPTDDPSTQKDLSTLILAMRKLREALVATSRADTFSTQAYIFITRLSILLRHPESYHPSLLHLLRVLHPLHPLPSSILSEFASYLVLDLACRQDDLPAAYEAKVRYKLKDGKTERALKCLVTGNYWGFWRVRGCVDGYKARVMEWAEEGVRGHALRCLGRSYFQAEVRFVESACGGRKWEELVKRDRVGWARDGGKVVIRKVKGS